MYWQGSAEELDVTLCVDRVVQRTWPRWGDLSPTCRSRNRATSASCRPTLWVVTALAHTHTHAYTHMQTQTHIQHPLTRIFSHTFADTACTHTHADTDTHTHFCGKHVHAWTHTYTHAHTLLWHTHYWTILESTLFDPDQLNHPAKWFKRWGL